MLTQERLKELLWYDQKTGNFFWIRSRRQMYAGDRAGTIGADWSFDMIGSCDNCDRQNVPVSNGQFCGCDTTQCYICQGDIADPYGELEEAVSEAMKDPVPSAEEQMERRCDGIIRELDELCAMAANKETVDLVEGQRVAIGQICMRAQLVASFLIARQPHLKVVQRG